MTHHDHDCDCGHDHEHEHEAQIITLVDEDGLEVDHEIIVALEVGGKIYYAITPIPEEDEEADEELEETMQVLFVKVVQDAAGKEETLEEIEDDDEWDQVTAAWEEYVETVTAGATDL